MAAAAGWLERPVLNSFSFDACIETFAHLRFAPPTSAARCASVMNEPWTCSQHVERGGVGWPKRSGGGREFLLWAQAGPEVFWGGGEWASSRAP